MQVGDLGLEVINGQGKAFGIGPDGVLGAVRLGVIARGREVLPGLIGELGQGIGLVHELAHAGGNAPGQHAAHRLGLAQHLFEQRLALAFVRVGVRFIVAAGQSRAEQQGDNEFSVWNSDHVSSRRHTGGATVSPLNRFRPRRVPVRTA